MVVDARRSHRFNSRGKNHLEIPGWLDNRVGDGWGWPRLTPSCATTNPAAPGFVVFEAWAFVLPTSRDFPESTTPKGGWPRLLRYSPPQNRLGAGPGLLRHASPQKRVPQTSWFSKPGHSCCRHRETSLSASGLRRSFTRTASVSRRRKWEGSVGLRSSGNGRYKGEPVEPAPWGKRRRGSKRNPQSICNLFAWLACPTTACWCHPWPCKLLNRRFQADSNPSLSATLSRTEQKNPGSRVAMRQECP